MGGRDRYLFGVGRGVGVAFGLLDCRLVWGLWYMFVLDCVVLADERAIGVRRNAGFLLHFFLGSVYQDQRLQFAIFASIQCSMGFGMS